MLLEDVLLLGLDKSLYKEITLEYAKIKNKNLTIPYKYFRACLARACTLKCTTKKNLTNTFKYQYF
jgi:hypothetical protein